MGATIPFNPSMNIGNDQTFVKRGSLWRESGVRLDKTAQLTNAVVGSGSLIGEGAVVTNSIIGRHVTLSPGVVVKDSILWDNVFVDQGVEINQSIVVSQKVQKNIQLGKRSVIPSICELPEGTKIPDTPYFTAYSSNGEPVLDDIDTEESDDEEQDEKFDISLLNLTDSEVSEIGSDSDSDENSTTVRRRRRSSASGRSDISTNDYFLYEARESLSRAFAENHSVDDAAIELTSLKMTTNVGFHEIREAIVTSMMNVLISQPGRAEPTFAKWSALLNRFIEDEESQLDIAFIAQEYFAKRIREQKAEKKIFVKGLHLLYDHDVLDEDVIFKWYESKKAQGMGERWSEEFVALRNAAQPLLNWLSEANEESDEE
jgi:translation initiation factor eIF-2B subunit epsilon